jgi:hypothetical protein
MRSMCYSFGHGRLADLLARWLAGHCASDDEQTKKLGENILALHIEMVHDLIKVNEKMLLDRVRTSGNA